MPSQFAGLARRAESGQVAWACADDAEDADDLRGDEAAVRLVADAQRNVDVLLEQVDVAVAQ